MNTPNVQRKSFEREHEISSLNVISIDKRSSASSLASNKSQTTDPSVLHHSPSVASRSKEQLVSMQRSSTCDSESCDFSGSDWAADELACDEEVRRITGDGTDQDTDNEITDEFQTNVPLIRVPSDSEENLNDGSDSPRTVAYSTETLVYTDQTSRKNSDESCKNCDSTRSLLGDMEEESTSVPCVKENSGEETSHSSSGSLCTDSVNIVIQDDSMEDNSVSTVISPLLGSLSPKIRHRTKSSSSSDQNC